MQKNFKIRPAIVSLFVSILLLLSAYSAMASEEKFDNSSDWFYSKEVAKAKYNKPIYCPGYRQRALEILFKDKRNWTEGPCPDSRPRV